MNIERSLKLLIETGKVYFGVEQAKRAVKNGEAKLLIVASNCPEEAFEEKTYKKVPILHFKGTNVELGAASGKPFPISVVTVVDPGDSDILSGKE
jgi:large subunit ribosomal protein L30e